MPKETRPQAVSAESSHAEAVRLFLRGRHLGCPGCGYDLCDLAAERCPECGHAPRLTIEDPRAAAALLRVARRGLMRYGWAFNVGTGLLLFALILPVLILLVGFLPLPRVDAADPFFLMVLLTVLVVGAGVALLLWWRGRNDLCEQSAIRPWCGAAVCGATAGLVLIIALMLLLL